MLTKAKSQNRTEYLAFRLSSMLATTGEKQPEDDFSWISVFNKKDREQFKSELYDAISKAIQADNWIAVEELIDSWQETAEIMSDKNMMKNIKKSMKESELGEVSRWEDVQKRLKL